MTILIDILESIKNEFLLSAERKKDFEAAAEAVFSIEGLADNFEISLSFVDNSMIQRLNKNFRKKDSPTDVLSFPQCADFPYDAEKNELGEIMLGDVIISLEKAADQALDFGHSLRREIVFLFVHSVLHLLGYDHELPEEALIMEEKQRLVMATLGIGR